jgi:uncharacterized protein YegL
MGTFVKRSNKVHILMVLDMSGSMASQWDDTIGGANTYFDGLREDKENDYSVTVINFDTDYEILCANRPVSEVPRLNHTNYHPRGGTALYDAIGRALTETESKVLEGEKAIVVVITDGEENSSVKETERTIKPRIERLQSKGNWTFVYLGAVANAWDNASKMGMSIGNTRRYRKAATRGVYSSLIGATQSYACSNSSATMDFFADHGGGMEGLEEEDNV